MRKSDLKRQLQDAEDSRDQFEELTMNLYARIDEVEQELLALRSRDFSATCTRCRKVLPVPDGFTIVDAIKFNQFDNNAEIKISFSGGYGQFIDSYDGPIDFSLNLCHECGHELAEFLDIDVSYWHTHNPASGQHPDHHKSNF